jgi:hypothetical protein
MYVGIRITNPWICIESWITNTDLKRFVLSCGSSQFSKDSTCFHKSNKLSQILSTIVQNESLKIRIRESRILTNLNLQTQEPGFPSQILKDSVCGFVLEKKIQKYLICIASEGFVYKSCNLNNVIILGQRETNNINRMIKIIQSTALSNTRLKVSWNLEQSGSVLPH